MADREDRLAPATRNYVIFGLVFVIAVGLAIFDWLDPRERRGEADSALRLLVVSSDFAGPSQALADLDGFNVAQVSPDEAITAGLELLDEDDEPLYRAAIAYADQLGYGFVALHLREPVAIAWGLDESPPDSARFAVFSVGDVAVEGPRMHAVGVPDGLHLDPRLAELDSVRLGLFEHPDFTRLWDIDPNASELQALRVFDSRKIDQRRETLQRDHEDWTALTQAWPTHETAPGSLAGPWERVQAAPIPGGLLLEVRAVRIHVDVYRRVRLELDEEATLEFLPNDALFDADPAQRQVGRQRCAGLPETVSTPVAVAPDGSALVIGGASGTVELFAFEQRAADPQCRARSLGTLSIGARAIGRPHAKGAMAWTYDGDWLHWWDALGEHLERIDAADSYSGPWWVDGDLLALIGESGIWDAESFAIESYEPSLFLVATTDDKTVRAALTARELFPSATPEHPSEPSSEPPVLLDLRPVGPHELLLTTDRCPDATDDARRCLHRVRAATPLSVTLAEHEASARPLAELLTIETLGVIDRHVELAVASEGSRVAWIASDERNVMIADLRGPQRMSPRRLDLEPTPDASLRISNDGRVVLSEIQIELVLRDKVVGSVQVPRAFELDPLPPEGS